MRFLKDSLLKCNQSFIAFEDYYQVSHSMKDESNYL